MPISAQKKVVITHNLCKNPLRGGERGIRTPGASQLNGFQDRRNRPLCHLSRHKSTHFFYICKLFLHFFRTFFQGKT